MSGLHAYGRFAQAEASLLADHEEKHWELQVQLGRTTVQFPIPSPLRASDILNFLRTHNGQTRSRAAKAGEHPGVPEGTPLYSMVAELEISEFVSLRKDGESPSRFIFALCQGGYQVFFDLLADEVEQLIGSLADLWNDWQGEEPV